MSTAVAGELRVCSPYDGEEVGRVALAGAQELRGVLDRAAAAGEPGSRHERSETLNRVAAALAERAEELARLISSESGLCLRDTHHELRRAQDVFRLAAMEALRDPGRSFAGDISPNGRDRRAHTLQIPVRLVVAITPFNHPLNQVAHRVAPAIAAGAPLVLKPSERTPLTALALSEILRGAGVAEERVSIVTAEPATFLDCAVAHEAVDVVSFTGGVALGKEIAGRLGYRRAVLELGGNDPLIVLPDADLVEAARLAVTGAFANSGQRCTAVKRILAHDAVADELAERVRAGAAALRVGDPLDEKTDMGTVITADAAAGFCERIADAVAGGAQLLHGGTHDGAVMQPAVLDHVPRSADLITRETFGPVAPIVRVRGLDDAIAVANSTPYALSAGLVTNDWHAIARCVRELRCGTVNVREVPGWRTELTPFGGVGDSGLGIKEGVIEAMRAMSWTKLYTLPWD